MATQIGEVTGISGYSYQVVGYVCKGDGIWVAGSYLETPPGREAGDWLSGFNRSPAEVWGQIMSLSDLPLEARLELGMKGRYPAHTIQVVNLAHQNWRKAIDKLADGSSLEWQGATSLKTMTVWALVDEGRVHSVLETQTSDYAQKWAKEWGLKAMEVPCGISHVDEIPQARVLLGWDQWALIDQNCSIPGADAAPIDWFETQAEAISNISNTGQWVESIPAGAAYRSDTTGEWVVPAPTPVTGRIYEYGDRLQYTCLSVEGAIARFESLNKEVWGEPKATFEVPSSQWGRYTEVVEG